MVGDGVMPFSGTASHIVRAAIQAEAAIRNLRTMQPRHVLGDAGRIAGSW
jgi:hypothetical protein